MTILLKTSLMIAALVAINNYAFTDADGYGWFIEGYGGYYWEY